MSENNNAELTDDIIQLGQSNKVEFYQILSSRETIEIEGSDGQFASVYIRYDSFQDEYERRVYSFGDLLGQVGGIYEFMLVSGMILVGIFSERLLVSSILHKIYQVDKRKESNINLQKTVKKNSSKTFPLNVLNTGKKFKGKFHNMIQNFNFNRFSEDL